ncbi:MAG: hypothetical protein AAFP18_17150 [Bacteroidota bacterium]
MDKDLFFVIFINLFAILFLIDTSFLVFQEPSHYEIIEVIENERRYNVELSNGKIYRITSNVSEAIAIGDEASVVQGPILPLKGVIVEPDPRQLYIRIILALGGLFLTPITWIGYALSKEQTLGPTDVSSSKNSRTA